MGIDGISKPGAGAPGGISNAPEAVGRVGDTFQVSEPASNKSVSGSEDLARLSRGEISLDQYLEARVEQAVAHLTQKLSPGELEYVRDVLREQLGSDPVLTELVRRSTA
jgi:hypothetical protein